jgi:hypothetical protein
MEVTGLWVPDGGIWARAHLHLVELPDDIAKLFLNVADAEAREEMLAGRLFGVNCPVTLESLQDCWVFYRKSAQYATMAAKVEEASMTY